ncbi:phage holin family protein [Geodermatophilus sp. TF02-6]|uniref:phage holin family protein n=1 Tax=Geodermatophilus sp. TF02-6 TaxID=2250575 RepID=UPI000DEA48DC|nr:phage holin family protein [Geodermatophilus sp. TF02-6]RBY80961.1 phage holin family protein [Geodermatophilus sp. TF02-6]
MLRFLIKVVLMAGVFYGVAYLLPGIEVLPNPDGPLGRPGTYLWIALIFAVVNAVVGPVLRLLSLPFVLLTLGLFLLVVNAALLGITAAITDRLQVAGFGTAVLGGLLLAIGNWIADQLVERG